MLIHLISDMARNHGGIQQRFAADALAVFAEYGITSQELAVLRGREAKAVEAHLGKEVHALVQQLGQGFPVHVAWPMPVPEILEVRPHAATVGLAVVVTVEGQNFAQTATLEFSSGDQRVSAVITDLQPGPNSTIKAQVTFTSAGAYAAVVANSAQEPSAPFANAIVVSR